MRCSQPGLVVLAVLLISAAPVAAQQETHCEDTFLTDISLSMDQPDGSMQTYSDDCSGESGCSHYFGLRCDEGDEVTVTFCGGGVGASFDSGLSTWSPSGGTFGDQVACSDNACADDQAALAIVMPATDLRIRIGAFEPDNGGEYTLGYQAPASCSIEVIVPVELQSFEVAARSTTSRARDCNSKQGR